MSNKKDSSLTKSRNYGFDILKILSVLAVVLLHSSSKFVEDATVFESSDFFMANTFNAVCRFAVPVFVMISGALMLEESKELPTKLIYSKYIKTIVHIFLFWSLLYTIEFAYIVPLNKGYTIHFDKVVLYFVQGHYHLWYLFMIIGLYISTPILRQFIRRDNEKTVLYFLKVGFIVQGIIPFIVQLIKTFDDKSLSETVELFSLDIFLGFSFYYVLGWYLHNFTLKKKTQNIIYILGAISVVFSVLFTYFMSINQGKPYFITYRNFYFNNVLYSAAIFLLFKQLFQNKRFSEKSGKIIRNLSALTFGVYIIHPFFIEAVRTTFSSMENQTLGIILMWLSAAAISTAVCFVLSKIPGVRKVIKM